MTARSDAGTYVISPGKVSNERVDYIALGSVDCTDLVCLRTAGSANPANTADEAWGYCSSPCIDKTNCSPDYQGKDNKLVCQRLLLDQGFLDSYKLSNPAEYEAVFGNGASSTYCILPSSAAR